MPQPPGVVEIISPRRNASIGNRVLRQAPRLGLMEDDEAVRRHHRRLLGRDRQRGSMRVQSIVNYGWHEAGWAMPWSAAFISWLACEAGLSTEQFRRSGAHIRLRARRGARARRPGPGHLFVAYDLTEATPAAGDLLCTSRGEASFASIADVRAGNSTSLSLHCDLVVKTDLEHAGCSPSAATSTTP